MALVQFDDVEVVRQGGEATLFRFRNGSEEWVPHSQFREGTTVDQTSDPGDRGTVVIPTWLADDRSLEYDDGDLV